MKNQLIVLFTLLSFSLSASAQKEYRVAKASGQLNLNISGAIIEGYSGTDIVFSIQKSEDEAVDERAKGLKALSGSGFTDNTGLGIDVAQNGQVVNVNMVARKLKGILNIKVPQNIKISFSYSNVMADEVMLKDLKNEITVSTTYNKIKLENNSGPMNIKTVYGSVDASFAGEIKGPVSIISVYSFVDVSLPATTKASLELNTSYGKLFAAEEFKIAIDKNNEEEKSDTDAENTSDSRLTSTDGSPKLKRYGNSGIGDKIKGKINGGGIDLIFKSNYNNVYLRKK